MKKMSFNEGWEVSSGGSSLMEAFRPGAGKKKSVQLPHDAMIHEKPVPEAAHRPAFIPAENISIQ